MAAHRAPWMARNPPVLRPEGKSRFNKENPGPSDAVGGGTVAGRVIASVHAARRAISTTTTAHRNRAMPDLWAENISKGGSHSVGSTTRIANPVESRWLRAPAIRNASESALAVATDTKIA